MASLLEPDPAWLQNQLQGLGGLVSYELDRSTILLTLAALVLLPVLSNYVISGFKKDDKIPVVNPAGPFELTMQKNIEFVSKGIEYFHQGKKRFPGQPFKLLTNGGPMTILPPERADEVKNKTSLTFRQLFLSAVPASSASSGAATILDHPKEVVQKAIIKHLTRRLNTITGPLAEETTFAINKVFGNNPEWSEITIYKGITNLIARLSSRVFLGAEICRNEEWLDLTVKNAIVTAKVLFGLRAFPSWLRPFVFWVGESGRDFRALYARACKIVDPVVKQRQEERADCVAKGLPPPVYNDAIEWVEAEANGDPSIKATDAQLNISAAAIHTTSDLLAYTMLLLATHPEYIQPLRQEMLEVLPVHGWKKTSLTSLKLLDSTVKEAQRLKPIQSANMQRRVTEDTELEGGIFLRKGELVSVDASNLWDPAKYENPESFNPYRFFEARKQPGGEHKSQLVSATADHLTFGYGKYACPGRFFAANEIKLSLCYLLLKYDWKLPEGDSPPHLTSFGLDPLVNPEARILYRRRKEELDIDSLDFDTDE